MFGHFSDVRCRLQSPKAMFLGVGWGQKKGNDGWPSPSRPDPGLLGGDGYFHGTLCEIVTTLRVLNNRLVRNISLLHSQATVDFYTAF